MRFLGFFLVIVYVPFVLGGVTWHSRRNIPGFTKLVSILGILFFGLGFLTMILEFLKFRPALILDEEGIINFTTAGGSYRIKWTEIKGFQIRSVGKHKFIFVLIKDPLSFISRANFFQQFWMKMNNKFYPTPATISTIIIDKKPEDLLTIIKEQKKEIRRINSHKRSLTFDN